MQVSSLSIYPVKSMAGIALSEMSVTAMGPQWDRRWMVVDPEGKFLTQRQLPEMCLIQCGLLDGRLRLSRTGLESLSLDAVMGPQVLVTVWNDQVMAQDCGDEPAQWLSEVLGRPCRLVFMTEETRRLVDPDFAREQEVVGFADGFPFLIISEASLQNFNQHLAVPIEMKRFRPNIVVSGCEPFAEDDWKILRIGEMEFSVVKPCSRCVIPSIDPATGFKQVDVSKALAANRRRDGAVYFGQNLLHRGLGKISVGDAVEVL